MDNLFEKNILRVENLVNLYEKRLTTGKQGRQPIHSTDVLRASVVLLHASLEDFLRALARERLPSAKEDVLNQIPLVGLSSHGRAEKFQLGKLAEHKGKSVSQLIDESVKAHLERSTYSDTKEIASLLEQVGLNVEPCRVHFKVLDQITAVPTFLIERAVTSCL